LRQRGRSRLTDDTVYAIMVDVEVTESGSVDAAKVRESMIPDSGMESCMVSALEAMSVPLSVMAKLISQSDSPQSRGYMGNVFVLGAAVNLVPIVIVAAGVTILVAVTVHVAEEAIEAIKGRKCPPCTLIDGTVVPVGTSAYRPMDTPPPGKVEHGISGPHYNLYKANQNPNNCQCFWQPIGAVPPPPQPDWIPIQPFAN
jgi:hypothetical protein